jgi:NitT/TauT family transport system substrate-binding protein
MAQPRWRFDPSGQTAGKLRRWRRLPIVAAILALGVAVSACGSTPSAGGASGKGSTITIIEAGSNDFTDGNLLRFVSVLQGEGYKVSVSLIEDQATALRAVVAGRADFFFGGMTEAVLANANSQAKIQVVGVSNQASDYLILSQKKFTLQNLSGATLGIAAVGDATQILVEAALRNKGVGPKSLKYVTVGGTSARVTALLAGQIDLAPVLAPSAVPAIATGKVKVLVNTGPAVGPYLSQTMIATTKFIQSHKPVVQAAVNALINAERWAQTDEKDYITTVNQAKLDGGLTMKQEQAAWSLDKQAGFNAVNGGLCAKYVTDTLNYSYSSGSLSRSQTPPQSVWLDKEFVQNYLKAHNQPVNTC